MPRTIVVDANIAFRALVAGREAELWTEDEALKSGLRARGFSYFFPPT